MPAAASVGGELFAQWRRDPLLWWHDNLAFEPYDWQQEILEAFQDPKTRAVSIVAPRGAGKTTLDAALCLHHLTTVPESVVLAVVPVWRQAETGLASEIKRLWFSSPTLSKLFPSWKVQSDGIETAVPGWRLILASSSTPAFLEGPHSIGAPLVLVDEARSLSDEHFDSLQGTLTTPGGRLVVSSVAGGMTGFLYRSLHGDRWFWDRTFVFTAEQIPHLREQRDRERKRLGADHPVFLQQWESKFCDVAETTLFDHAMIEKVLGLDAHGDELYPSGPRDRILGVDVAGRGADDSAAVLKVGKNIEKLILLPKTENEMATVELICLEATRHRVDVVVVDEIGLGGPIAARLAQRLEGAPRKIDVLRYNAAAAARDRDAYANLKTETLVGIRKLMIDKRLGLPPADAPNVARLVEELCGFSLREAAGGRVKVEDPADSPDFADALISCFVFDEEAIEPGVAIADVRGA